MSTVGHPSSSASHPEALAARLAKLLSRPQRHRLLHGYPLAAAMPYATADLRRQAASQGVASQGVGSQRAGNQRAGTWQLSQPAGVQLLVGVLPHPFCNPKIAGCGFCTFPHETFNARRSVQLAQAIVQEVEQRLAWQPELERAEVAALYFGGGTANLTPVEPFRLLCRTFSQVFDLRAAEISLEGVPANFLRGQPPLWDILQSEMPARHFRISMGMQTFNAERLQQMGRLGFGQPQTFAQVVRAAHGRGMTTSGDLLFNLPSQSLTEMLDDVQQAVDIGLDQICLYHLVMFRGLGTVWSRDPALIASLPDNDQAAHNWQQLREHLLSQGYRQTSLTNFERHELKDDARRYCYEPISYAANHCQALGFGPGGISFTASHTETTALKTLNPESAAEYLQAVQSATTPWTRYFKYQQADLEVLHLTRRLAALHIDKALFAESFGATAWSRYTERLDLLQSAGLMSECEQHYSLTPTGMFFADAIAGLLAETRWQNGSQPPLVAANNSNSRGFM